jgi:hypothetical protein
MTQTKRATDAIETGSNAVRALAVGAFALGAAAIGAIAVGAIAIGPFWKRYLQKLYAKPRPINCFRWCTTPKMQCFTDGRSSVSVTTTSKNWRS